MVIIKKKDTKNKETKHVRRTSNSIPPIGPGVVKTKPKDDVKPEKPKENEAVRTVTSANKDKTSETDERKSTVSSGNSSVSKPGLSQFWQ